MFFLGVGINTMIQGDRWEKDSECAETNYVDVKLVQNAKNLHGKPLQEGCEGLEIDKDERQGGWCE